MSVVRHLIL